MSRAGGGNTGGWGAGASRLFSQNGLHVLLPPKVLTALLRCPPPSPPPRPAEVQIPEARAFYAFQSAIETVHR